MTDEEAIELRAFGDLKMSEAAHDRFFRHMSVARNSDYEHLRLCLKQAADRFEDLANIIERDRGYDPVGFLRSSAARYRDEAENN